MHIILEGFDHDLAAKKNELWSVAFWQTSLGTRQNGDPGLGNKNVISTGSGRRNAILPMASADSQSGGPKRRKWIRSGVFQCLSWEPDPSHCGRVWFPDHKILPVESRKRCTSGREDIWTVQRPRLSYPSNSVSRSAEEKQIIISASTPSSALALCHCPAGIEIVSPAFSTNF